MRDTLRRWAIPLGAALFLVTLSGLPALAGQHLTSALTGGLLLAVTAAWYLSLDARFDPEALPKLRVAGVGAATLLLGLLYGLLVAALGLPEALAGLLFALLLGGVGATFVVLLGAAADLALLARMRWTRVIVVGLGAGLAATVLVSAIQADTPSRIGPLDPSLAPIALVVAMAMLAFSAPLEWFLALDVRQRIYALVGGVTALLPLAAAISIGRLVPLPHHHLLSTFVRLGAMLSLVYLVVVMARVAFTLPGARAYERKVREIDAIYDFGLAAGTAFKPDELQSAVLDSLRRVTEPDVAVVVEPEPDGPGCACVLAREDAGGEHLYRYRSRASWSDLAATFADRRPAVIVDHQKAPPGALKRIWEPASGSSVVVPVIPREGGPRAVLIAGRFDTHAFNAAEVRSLSGFANQVALAMDHARLLRETVEAERRKREFEIAQELQSTLLPASAPDLPRLDIAARSEPASELGGDYYDYLMLKSGNLGLVVGDVAGHGVAAGLLMGVAKSALLTQAQSDSPPTVLMERLGKTLLQMSADNQFMTLVFAELDPVGERLSYSNAGHHYPIHYMHAIGEVRLLESTGLPLGLLPRPPGPFEERPLGAGDVLAFYSDGVVEAGPDEDHMFGTTRLARVVLANRRRSANTIVEAVFEAVRSFCGDTPLRDDATIVIVRVLPENTAKEAEDDEADVRMVAHRGADGGAGSDERGDAVPVGAGTGGAD